MECGGIKMEYDKIKQLMEDMGNSKLTSIDIDFPDGTKISMKKDLACETKVVQVESKAIEVNDTKEKVEVKEVNTWKMTLKIPFIFIYILICCCHFPWHIFFNFINH